MFDARMTSCITSCALRRKVVLMTFLIAAFIAQFIPWHAHAQENKDWLEAAGKYLYVTRPTKFSTEVESWKDGKINDTGKLEVYIGDFPKDRYSGTAKILVRFTEEGIRKGRLILYESERSWMYFRGTNQAIRIPAAEQLIGDADVASVLNLDLRESYSIKDVKVESGEDLDSGEDVESGEDSPRAVIELSDKTGNAPYASVLLTLDANTSRPIEAKFYSLSGKLVRTVEYLSFQPFQGQHILQTVKITAHLNAKSDYTLLKYVAVKPYELPRRFFVPALLKDL